MKSISSGSSNSGASGSGIGSGSSRTGQDRTCFSFLSDLSRRFGTSVMSDMNMSDMNMTIN